ncbi:hypothetical protein SS45_24415 [Enterobacter hormaechei subsp. steigerwaltii]|uniref:ead/Ea22-like family protein n=1 Tax=Enterobacter hormaechei TaxID=158836 RepID=UPI0005EED4FE|nr:ead/Ea22-like family protein [Enterobacter hormaechei]HCJ7345045.1 ead/Ea22-like family protein [Enterobacter hormaechei subsp. xiangfangensis]KJN36846.1 hypothetical protein SS45_24415 [Enterobacter hormaechei subsp. steigerwaltii]CZZ77386.1 Uncharacterised protein [Enterobacter hormaechei]SAA10587.1 Uncharacterised protein [Enterobacter hormaechei]SAA89108.1 Uncharacterised protein [Enterobacter hormaechei]
MSNIDKRALREVAENHGDDDILALLDELEAAEKRIAELEKSHAQVIQARDHYKRMCEEGFRRINKGINLSINGEG